MQNKTINRWEGVTVQSDNKQFSLENISKYRGELMGLQILMIIFFHFTLDCRMYNVRYSGIVYWFDKYFHSSGVDMFLLLSGLGLYFSWKKKPHFSSFYKKRYTRILIPYFIVAVPAWIWYDIFCLNKSAGEFIKDLFFVTFVLGNMKWFWYILMIAVCYWFFPYVYDIVENTSDRISQRMRILLLCTLSTVLAVMLQQYYNELYVSIGVAVLRIPAFLIGVLMGKAVYEKRTVSYRYIAGVLISAVIIAWPLQMTEKSVLGVYASAFLNYAFSLVFVLILSAVMNSRNFFLKKVHNITTGILGWFGKYTLELYLLHVLIRRVMLELGYKTYRLKYEAILVLVSVILSVSLNRATGVICKKMDALLRIKK